MPQILLHSYSIVLIHENSFKPFDSVLTESTYVCSSPLALKAHKKKITIKQASKEFSIQIMNTNRGTGKLQRLSQPSSQVATQFAFE